MVCITEAHPWGIKTPLYQNEALSSWLIRAALDCGCDPLSLTGIFWPKWRPWTLDIDQGLSQEYSKILVSVTSITQDQFDAATFKDLYLHNSEVSFKSWILALGAKNRKHKGGWQYCPKCLQEDSNAYFRLNWRCIWHVGCTKHDQRLLDQCPYCHSAIQPRLLEAPDRVIYCCAICKKHLFDEKEYPIDHNALAFQEDFDLFLKQGYAFYTDVLISIPEWLKVIQLFNQLIRKVLTGSLDSRGWKFLHELGITVPHNQLISTGLVLNQLSVLERERIFSCIYQLLNISHEQFVETACSLNMTRASFWDKRYQLPTSLLTIEKRLGTVSRGYSSLKVYPHVPKPSNKEAVLRKILRLKRKIL
ncbi:TniQ family protein [Acinetobacter baumannii]|nr:TniQ family protein [Acinetobacter baumannii]